MGDSVGGRAEKRVARGGLKPRRGRVEQRSGRENHRERLRVSDGGGEEREGEGKGEMRGVLFWTEG